MIIPNSPQLSVLNGGCLFGLNPTVIHSRRSMLTYGIAVLQKFDPNIHPTEKKMVANDEEWCYDVFDRFVTVNQTVNLFESIKRRFMPIISDQKLCTINIYSTNNPDVYFITDEGVKKCATIHLQLEPIPTKINPAIKELFEQEIEIDINFSETEIKV